MTDTITDLSTIGSLRETLVELANARAAGATFFETLVFWTKALEALPEYQRHKDAKETDKAHRGLIANLEAACRTIARTIAQRDRTKDLLPGVEIRETTRERFEITDHQVALNYALRELRQVVVLDEAAFQKMVAAMPESARAKIPGIAYEVIVDPFGEARLKNAEIEAYADKPEPPTEAPF